MFGCYVQIFNFVALLICRNYLKRKKKKFFKVLVIRILALIRTKTTND